MIAVVYLDACPECPPGIPPASPATGIPEQVPGGVVTPHQCEDCGTAWSAFWRGGWVIDRTIAPVAASSGWPVSRTEAA